MYDILIIGGGLAGLNTANILIQNKNLNVGLVELGRSSKNNPARFTYADVLKKYDLYGCIIKGYTKFGVFTYHGAKSLHVFDRPVFAALDYNKACDKLLSKNKNNTNFTYIKDHAVDINQENDGITIVFKSGKQLKTKLLVDASGSRHFSLKMLSLNTPELYSHSMGQTFEGVSHEDAEEAYFVGASVDYGSGGGWYYPFDANKASIGLAVITTTSSFPAKELKQKYFKAIKEIYPFSKYLTNARATGWEVGTIPIQHVRNIVNGRIMMIGDSAGQATPWMCMGVEPALENSALAANSILAAFDQADFSLSALAEYQKRWDTQNKVNFELIDDQPQKIWFHSEAVWDFIIESDLNKISPEQFYARIKRNAFLMSKVTTLYRWAIFRLKHLFDWQKFKSYK